MDYISSSSVIHGDLAARHVFVGEGKTLKISHFEQSKKCEPKGMKMTTRESSSHRWMAPDAIKNRVLTFGNDVWAYGVTFWEIFTLGEDPYHNMKNVFEYVSRNGRLKMPHKCPQRLFRLIALKCWDANPETRPTFQELVVQMRKLKSEHVMREVADHQFVENPAFGDPSFGSNQNTWEMENKEEEEKETGLVRPTPQYLPPIPSSTIRSRTLCCMFVRMCSLGRYFTSFFMFCCCF
eukprot:m.88920 g.88920  ORF g.88920 m.88920 type:complete len:237 (-) comp12279_c0_seq9:402-1112(-)